MFFLRQDISDAIYKSRQQKVAIILESYRSRRIDALDVTYSTLTFTGTCQSCSFAIENKRNNAHGYGCWFQWYKRATKTKLNRLHGVYVRLTAVKFGVVD